MKIRIKGTEKIYENRKEVKDAFGQFRYRQFLKEKAFDYLDEDGNVVENVPIKPKNNANNTAIILLFLPFWFVLVCLFL